MPLEKGSYHFKSSALIFELTPIFQPSKCILTLVQSFVIIDIFVSWR